MAGVGATCGLSFGLYSVSSHGTARVLSVKTVQGFRMTQAYGQSKLKEERERMNEPYLPTELTSVKKNYCFTEKRGPPVYSQSCHIQLKDLNG